VVLTGPTRPAKSRLLRALAGVGPKPSGEILIDGVDLYAYRKLFAPHIGYVPSRPVLHPALTVQEILDYEARLRMVENHKTI
jgi:ABC-2 type transport system ATP-binding protein